MKRWLSLFPLPGSEQNTQLMARLIAEGKRSRARGSLKFRLRSAVLGSVLVPVSSLVFFKMKNRDNDKKAGALPRAFSRGDDLGIHAGEVESAPVAAMLHLDAFVDDDGESRGQGALGGVKIDDAQLHPDGGGIDAFLFAGDGLVDDFVDVLRRAENIDEVDGEGDAGDVGVDLFAEDRVGLRVDRHDAVAFVLEITGDEVAGFLAVTGETDERDCFRRVEQVIDLRNVLKTGALFGREACVERDGA